MTPILKVLTEYCAPYIDDIRLNELSVTDPPLYARKLWGYLYPQMARFNIPTDMPEYLYGTAQNPKLTEPQFASSSYKVQTDATEPIVVNLGADYIGYELFACRILTYSATGTVTATPTNIAQYQPEAGTVTIAADTENPIAKGTVFDFDFYTDGYFANDLSPGIMTVLGMCFEIGWTTRFENDYLSYVDKVEDQSFYEQNRANRMRSGNERLEQMEKKLAGAMRRLEQVVYEKQINPPQPPI